MPPKHLRSKPALLFQPLTVAFTVEAHGDIKEAPRKFLAGKDEIVTWIVGNASGEKIKVSLSKFLRRKHHTDETGDPNDEVKPCIWIGSDAVTLEAGQTGIIAGRVDPNYDIKGFFDHLSYTIRVAGQSFGTIDYDPDGDIKP